jgi:hypothetical protein
MKSMSFIISMFLLALSAQSLTANAAPTASYCWATGGGFTSWSWGKFNSQDAYNDVVVGLAEQGGSVQFSNCGYYALDKFNRGTLYCAETTQDVSGYGPRIFASAASIVQLYNLTTCSINLYWN